MTPAAFKVGEELTSGSLNAWQEAGIAGGISADGSSGLVGISGPAGSSFLFQRRPEGWFKIGAAPGGSPAGTYQITEQVDLQGGVFADGPMVRLAYPLPGSGTPPTDGTAIVRAWKDRASWRFEWGAC